MTRCEAIRKPKGYRHGPPGRCFNRSVARVNGVELCGIHRNAAERAAARKITKKEKAHVDQVHLPGRD